MPEHKAHSIIGLKTVSMGRAHEQAMASQLAKEQQHSATEQRESAITKAAHTEYLSQVQDSNEKAECISAEMQTELARLRQQRDEAQSQAAAAEKNLKVQFFQELNLY